MKYASIENFQHDTPERIGVLITNLGTPDAPDKAALKRYLKEFLWDPRVVEFPRPLWWLVLNGIILNVRPARSAEAYKTVWTDEGSPLMVHTKAQARELRSHMTEALGDKVVVEFAMRYGQPSISSVVNDMLNKGVRQLLVLPLYPQYSGSTTGSTFDALANDFTRRRWLPEMRFVDDYYSHPAYISAVAQSIRTYRETHGSADLLLFSYHGVPRRYIDNGDPYWCQCRETTRMVIEELGLAEGEYQTVFQSRFGREEWLRPYTDETLKTLPGQGIKSVQMVCPGFSSDCLETIEEIGVENRDYFLEAGGERYEYIPCLNSEPAHINALASIIKEQLAGWI